jgi:hypothetical protein
MNSSARIDGDVEEGNAGSSGRTLEKIWEAHPESRRGQAESFVAEARSARHWRRTPGRAKQVALAEEIRGMAAGLRARATEILC